MQDPILVIEAIAPTSPAPNLYEATAPVKPNSPSRIQTPPLPLSYGITLGALKNVKGVARDKILADANRNASISMNQNNLIEAWREVVEQIASEKMLYKSAILESELTFAGTEVTIHANVVAFDFLKSERIRLLDFFKAHYHNELINVLFAAKLSDLEKTGDQVMSTREIFDMLAAKNPNLRILKDKLGMDIEY